MKGYNNLFDSILMTILSILIFSFGVCIEYFGVFMNENNLNKVWTSLVILIFFCLMTFLSLYLIYTYCFEKWWIEDDAVFSKKIFRKPIKIKFNSIESIDEVIVSALVFDTFKSDAIVITSEKKTIQILKTKYVVKNHVLNIIKDKTSFT